VGRFYLAHQGRPSALLLDFISGRCGSAALGSGLRALSGDVPDTVSDDDVLAQWHGRLEKMIESLPQGPGVAAGVWFGRAGGKAVVVLVEGELHTRDASLRQIAGSPRVIVSGELSSPATEVLALVNRGQFGVDLCEVDRTVALPRFAVSCEVEESDDAAWIDVAALEVGHLLPRSKLHVLTLPRGQAVATFHRPAAVEAPPPSGNLAADVVATVNSARARAALPPLALEPAESDVAQRLAPRYFAAELHLVPQAEGELVALGLMAGWDVQHGIREGLLAGGWLASKRSVEELISLLLASPSGRYSLLHKDARYAAVGAFAEAQATAVLVTTYLPADATEPNALQDRVGLALDSFRHAQRQPKGTRVEAAPALSQALQASLDKGGDPTGELDAFMRASAPLLGPNVHGWVLTTSTLKDIPFPDALVTAQPLAFTVAVARFKPRNEPWYRYAVYIAFGSGAGAQLARAPGAISPGCGASPACG
jgi:hypothetical protein